MTFKTTHEERVAMLREETAENINGMWLTLLAQGTAEAIDAFRDAAKEAGFDLDYGEMFGELPKWIEVDAG